MWLSRDFKMGIIKEVILFISEESRACTPCVNLVREYSLPVKIVRLDTKEARSKAKYNKKISIKNVPTLATMFDDDDVNIYIGNEKICKWLRVFKTQVNEANAAINTSDSDDVCDTQDDKITIVNDDSDEEVVDLSEASERVLPNDPPPKPSAMKSTLEKAKEMEEQMKKQLGGNAFENKTAFY